MTLYDSPNYERENVNLDHTFAIQPLVLRTANKEGFTGFVNGLEPTEKLEESLGNLGVLGDPNEKLLHKALQMISPGPGSAQATSKQNKAISTEILGGNTMNDPTYQRMYVDFETLDY